MKREPIKELHVRLSWLKWEKWVNSHPSLIDGTESMNERINTLIEIDSIKTKKDVNVEEIEKEIEDVNKTISENQKKRFKLKLQLKEIQNKLDREEREREEKEMQAKEDMYELMRQSR